LDHEHVSKTNTMRKLLNKTSLQGLLIVLLSLSVFSGYGQYWQQLYHPQELGPFPTQNYYPDFGRQAIQTKDGGYAVFGDEGVAAVYTPYNYLMKLDIYGNVQWYRNYPEANDQTGAGMVESLEGGYTMLSTEGLGFTLRHVDQFGDQQYEKFHMGPGGSGWLIPHELIQQSDSTYYAIGEHRQTITGYDGIIVHYNANGDSVWSARTNLYDLATSTSGYLNTVQAISGGGVIAAGSYYDGSQSDCFITRVDTQGDTVWTKTIDNFNGSVDEVREITNTADGNFLLLVKADVSNRIIKMDFNGNVIWNNSISITGMLDIATIDDVGSDFYVSGQMAGFGFIGIARTDSLGNEEWVKEYTQNVGPDYMASAISPYAYGRGMVTSYGGYVVVHSQINLEIASSTAADKPSVVNCDSLGNVSTISLQGHVFSDDIVSNCIYDQASGEQALHGYYLEVIESFGNNDTFYVVSQFDGSYWIPLNDTGNYVVNAYPNNPYSSSALCYTGTFNAPMYNDTIVHDVAAIDTIGCAYVNVDISSPFMRRCFDNIAFVNYCNNGTAAASNMTIDVELDPYMTFNSTTGNLIASNPPVYTFDVGTLAEGQCGNFQLEYYINCDSTFLGQTHCLEATASADSLCIPASPIWDQSSLALDATCINDTVRFKIENIGTGDMAVPRAYYVTEENIMLINSNFQLDSGDSLIILQPADGFTYRLIATQAPGHPWNDDPVAISIEACGDTNNITPGIFTTVPEYDNFPYASMDCQPSVGSYDPNDKRAIPEGVGPQHLIEDVDELDYHIRFQNTGSDTAFTVVIRDTLSNYLDITTVVPGASSHPYTYQLLNGRVLQFTFDNILLPDSAADQLGSNGFVKLHVEQIANNPVGTVIENSAAIFFDFNAPVITNTTFNTIGEDFIVLKVEELATEAIQINAYPNPFTEQTTIEVNGKRYDNLTFQVFDITGQLVFTKEVTGQNQIVFSRNGLQQGMYLFAITSENQRIGAGKLIIK
jgi:hypothetical protein